MRKSTQAAQKVFRAPSQMDWTDDKLAALSKEQLLALLANLQTQRECGRVSDEMADDLAQRLAARLPARARSVQRKRPRAQVMLEARAAQELSDLAALLAERFDLSAATAQQQSADIKGFKAQALTDKRGEARSGGSVKHGLTQIDRYVAYRVRDSMASLAFMLPAGKPQEAARYVVVATADLLEAEPEANEFSALAENYGWSENSRARMRAVPAINFADAQQRYESLIARLAARLA